MQGLQRGLLLLSCPQPSPIPPTPLNSSLSPNALCFLRLQPFRLSISPSHSSLSSPHSSLSSSLASLSSHSSLSPSSLSSSLSSSRKPSPSPCLPKMQLFVDPNLPQTADKEILSPSTPSPSSPSPPSPSPPSSLLSMLPKQHHEELDLNIPHFNSDSAPPFDLVVVGAGPAGLSVAQRVSAAGLRVLCVDPSPKSVWPNNYGVWVDEFEDMGLADCLDYTWPKAVVFLDDDKKKFLDRPYGRVNRLRLKTKMMEMCVQNGVVFHAAKVETVFHAATRSVVTCSDGVKIDAAVVLDATGFSRRLVEYDEPFNPGYQAAWGILAEVEAHPFPLDQMLFMDWRDSHLQSDADLQRHNEALPTFLYAMPFSKNRIFLEETSLVARPAVNFSDIQKRLEARLKHLGIKVLKIEEEEYCLIPMGGALPSIPQRVLGIGGTAGMVHPSTGYMVARTLAAAPLLADAIVQRLEGQIRRGSTSAKFSSNLHMENSETSSSARRTAVTVQEAVSAPQPLEGGDEISAQIWEEVWPIGRREQREFFCFGMDVLLRLDLHGTRRFFDAFFDLSPFHWQGFLSSRLYLAELIGFGLSLFAHATNGARFEIMAKGLPGLGVLVRNVINIRSRTVL